MKIGMELETERTWMRKLTVEDAADLYRLNADPDVIKYTGDDPFTTIDEARQFLAQYDQYTAYGVGRLAVIEKSTQSFIGWCGLKYTPETHAYDIGFRFFKACWNRGFATETAKKCLEYGFEVLNLDEIISRVMKDNMASIQVLKKLGMSFQENIDFAGKEGVVYGLLKADSSI
jgi:RimJ/RimL family protein N-acetyltransferase